MLLLLSMVFIVLFVLPNSEYKWTIHCRYWAFHLKIGQLAIEMLR